MPSEQIMEIAWCFACYKLIEIKRWSKNVGVGIIKNVCGQSGHGTLKLAVSQEWINRMNWFYACWCKFRKTKSYFSDFWVGKLEMETLEILKNGVLETLKSAVSQEWVYELSWFSACWKWFFACWLWILVKMASYSISLAFKCQSTAFVIVGPLPVVGSVL